jgi:uncharacterized membrane protein
MASAKDFFREDERNAIVDAIRKVEMNTSGEIRVHIEDLCKEDVFEKAVKIFHTLNMEKTPFRNAVLIYVAVKDRKFAVIGDEAIHNKVEAAYWEKISQHLLENFRSGNYANGIIHTVETIGETLVSYFPDIDALDKNNLPDDISFE